MSEVKRRDRSIDAVLTYGAYDAIVFGGGISGVCAARALAAAGRRVALLEPTGTLGREITRAYHMFARISDYAEQSPSICEYAACLRSRNGMFGDQLDPAAAALAFDDMLERYSVDVLFHVWPSRLVLNGKKVIGAEVVCRSGRILLEAPVVIDASVHGKLGSAGFRSAPSNKLASIVHLIYNGVTGECPDEKTISMPGAGELHVACRPTRWSNEWRVSLALDRRLGRPEWQLLLEEITMKLREEIPALRSGVLAHMGDDASEYPNMLISTGSEDSEIVGYAISPDAEAEHTQGLFTVAITRGMLCNPDIADGLYLAGPWLEGYPFDPGREEAAIVNAFALGDSAGRAALQRRNA
ncbi:FAD-dependent oxidoreductase [Paenibacillus sp. MBLB4367]|uniref:FAD-dependent oxidoreductase n=1 Tax=Paenibacillus sp. MBLB4367 TaxID=3384767 RepID=UPI0039082F52